MIIYIIITIFISFLILKFSLYEYITNVNYIPKLDNNNLLYDEYFNKNIKKKGNKIIGNLIFYKKYLNSNIYIGDLKILNFSPEIHYNILSISNTNLDFEISIINKFPNCIILSPVDDILEFNNLKEKLIKNKLNDKIILFLSDYQRIPEYNFEIKFDYIIFLQTIGFIRNRTKFIDDIKKHTNNGCTFYLKNMVYRDILKDNSIANHKKEDIFQKQIKFIDFWNYNFTTSSSLCNSFIDNGFDNIKVKEIPIYFILLNFTFHELVSLLKIYFIDLDKKCSDLSNWEPLLYMNIQNMIVKI